MPSLSRYAINVLQSTAGSPVCIVLMSLVYVYVQEELHDYYRLLAVLEQQLSVMSSSGAGDLSLLRLKVWLKQPLDRCVCAQHYCRPNCAATDGLTVCMVVCV